MSDTSDRAREIADHMVLVGVHDEETTEYLRGAIARELTDYGDARYREGQAEIERLRAALREASRLLRRSYITDAIAVADAALMTTLPGISGFPMILPPSPERGES